MDSTPRQAVISGSAYQDQILPHVSRTFALTIPQLPETLRVAVTNAYLLCRIADTIEDEPAIAPDEKLALMERFTAVVAGHGEPVALASVLAGKLSDRSLPAERDLVSQMHRVVDVTLNLPAAERAPIQRCVELMCYGMPRFQASASVRGLPRVVDLDEYCYYVAGVVGDMLTELFCEYSSAIASRRAAMQRLAVSFAEGLQMTNILKDMWEDRSRGVCWLPQEVFGRHGIDLARLSDVGEERGRVKLGFTAAVQDLVAIAHAHLRNALEYTLLIPRRERGIRRFCLWAIGLAILTLRKIHLKPHFESGREVKVSRQAVAMTRILTDTPGPDSLLRALFKYAARGLPLATIGETRRPSTPATDVERAYVAPERLQRRSYGGSGN